MFGNLFKKKRCDDEIQLAKLKSCGADLNQHHIINFLFDATKVEAARAIAEELSGKGFRAQIILSDDGLLFTCKATAELIPKLEVLHSLTQELTQLAKRYDCTYTGWQAETIE